MIALYIVAYFLVGIAFMFYDSFVGFDFEFDGGSNPPLILAALFWPITIPIVSLEVLSSWLDKHKQLRVKRCAKKAEARIVQERFRIAQEHEVDLALKQVEEELKESEYETQGSLRR